MYNIVCVFSVLFILFVCIVFLVATILVNKDVHNKLECAITMTKIRR